MGSARHLLQATKKKITAWVVTLWLQRLDAKIASLTTRAAAASFDADRPPPAPVPLRGPTARQMGASRPALPPPQGESARHHVQLFGCDDSRLRPGACRR